MIDRPTNRRTQNVKKTIATANTNSVKTRKWEKLIGWNVEQEHESNYIGIEAWSKRRLKNCTSDVFVEYLCSNDHFCSAIVDRDSFIDSSLEKDKEKDGNLEKSENEDEEKCDEVYGKEEIAFDKSVIEKDNINKDLGNSIVHIQSKHIDSTDDRNDTVKSSSSKEIGCKALKYESSNKVRPTSSNSLPEKKATRTAPRRHALSANDTYINFPGGISTFSNKVKFSYTKKDELTLPAKQVDNSTNENDVDESSSYQNELVSSYNFNHLQLPKKYELPNSANVSIGDLLYSSPRIEMYHSRERDIVFAALANEMNCDLSKSTTVLCDNHTDTSLGLPPVTQKPKNINGNKQVNGFKTVAGMPKIPLLANNASKSADETLLNKMMMESNMADATEEINSGKPTSLGGYVTSSRCNEVNANYNPKAAPTYLQEYCTTVIGIKKVKTRKPRGPPAFRPTTSKTPLHRAIESAHKKIHGPHQRLLSKSISRLADAVEAPNDNRRWSSSLPTNKQLTPEVNNTVAWRKELESHIRYQRSTSQLKASAPLINQVTNNTTVAISKLSRRKKTQLRIGDKLYNVGIAAQSAGRLHQTRISVER